MNEPGSPIGENSGYLSVPRQEVQQLLAAPPPSTGSGQFEDDGFDLRWMWQVLAARWYWVVAAGVLGLAAALAQSLMSVPLYRSTASLELNPPSVTVLGGGQGEELSVANTDWEFLATQYGLLRSRDLARRVVEDLNLVTGEAAGSEGRSLEARVDDVASELASSITVTPVPDSRLVELSYISPDPQRAATVVNGYAEAFLDSSLERRFNATARARNFLNDRLQTLREELNSSEQALVEYARANGIIMAVSGSEEGGGSTSLTTSSLTSLNSALAEAQQRRIAAEQRYRQAGSISDTQAATASLRSERATLQTEYQEKSTYLQDDYPEMVRLRARIAALDSAIRNESGQASNALQAEFRAAQAEENALRSRVQQLSGNVFSEQERSVEYNVLQRELDSNRSLYEALLERYNELGAIEGISTPQAAIVDLGQVPSAAFSPNIPRNLILGLLLGLGCGVALAFAYEFLTDKITTPDDVRDKLRQAYLGAVPKKKRKEDLASQLSEPRSAISEAYGSLLTKLQFSTNSGMPGILAVTSAVAAEGKSTSSLVLAQRLAQLGKRVLLIDGDLRRPSFVVEESSEIGFSRLLTGLDDVSKHIVMTAVDGLHLMPSGPIPPNPSLLLNSPDARQLLSQLKLLYDHIVIDCPPVLGFADAILLGHLSDGVLIVVESGKNRRRVVVEAIGQLEAVGNRIFGVILTKFSGAAAADGYYYAAYESDTLLGNRSDPHELMPHLLDDRQG